MLRHLRLDVCRGSILKSVNLGLYYTIAEDYYIYGNDAQGYFMNNAMSPKT